ncbi:helix-hairpin-helix domain-containing protein [Pontibacter sp. G13]|uniref:ComEA family DNA-binding protein n=1 Tax=Pontibacter sp. G13 TaxID=3074898 RepID=UPI00288C0820|nr:helix-hairpin-helix domain-containing protein [Pontibacter sp. G13]WNJ17034.1 helix-hairpin-helix domain-containing protein [Pontibacter sp. G13]
MRILMLWAIWLCPIGTIAQDPFHILADPEWESLPESEQPDESLMEDIAQQRSQWLSKPLDLNRADAAALEQLPGLDPIRIHRLLQHQQRLGPLASIYELQAVRDWQRVHIVAILPYVQVVPSSDRDVSHQAGPLQFPTAEQLKRALTGKWLTRWSRTLESQKGYSPESSSRYAGSPWKHRVQFQGQSHDHIRFAWIGQQDAGESFHLGPSQWGWDFQGAHVAISKAGHLKRAVIGDYQLQMGQGLVVSRGLGFGKGSQVIRSMRPPDGGIQPSRSIQSSRTFRGYATHWQAGNWEWTHALSLRKRDATLHANEQGQSFIQTLSTSTLHRTESERAKRQSVREWMLMDRIQYRFSYGHIGISQQAQWLNLPLIMEDPIMGRSGNHQSVWGLDAVWNGRGIHAFGEWAFIPTGGWAGLAGAMTSLAPTLDLGLFFRRYGANFHNPYAYVFGESPRASNEQGHYLGLTWQATRQIRVVGYLDMYQSLWRTYSSPLPEKGWEGFIEGTFSPSRHASLTVRFRREMTETAQKTAESPLAHYGWEQLDLWRIQAKQSWKNGAAIQFRAEARRFIAPSQVVESGWMIYLDGLIPVNRSLRFGGRISQFDVSDPSVRIYSYERQVSGVFSLPSQSGGGTSMYVVARWKPIPSLQLEGRIAQTTYGSRCPDGERQSTCTLGSGGDAITGRRKTNLTLQGIWSW